MEIFKDFVRTHTGHIPIGAKIIFNNTAKATVLSLTTKLVFNLSIFNISIKKTKLIILFFNLSTDPKALKNPFYSSNTVLASGCKFNRIGSKINRLKEGLDRQHSI